MESAFDTSLTHRDLGAVARRQHGIFTERQARACGVSESTLKRRVAAGDLRRAGRGIYCSALAPPSWHQNLLAACFAANAIASHRSAAELWGLDGVERGLVEITTLRHRRSQVAGVICHESQTLFRDDVTEVDGIVVTAPTRTLLDLAVVLGPDDVEVALDDALRRSLTSVPRLRTMLEVLGPMRRGRRCMEHMLSRRPANGAVPESILETRFAQLLRDSGLPEPQRQLRVQAVGRVAYIDFAYPENRVAIEIDGYEGHGGRSAWQAGLERSNSLTELGWKVLHFSSTDLEQRPEEVVARIRRSAPMRQ